MRGDWVRTFTIIGVLAFGASAARAGDLAVWKEHTYSFQFMGFTTTYSCDGLADKLTSLLLAAGARADAKVRSGACASGFGRPDKFANATLTFHTLAPASGNTAETETVQGVWMPVTISQQKPRGIGRGDCELVEQFKSAVLPMFSTRNVDSHTTCVPHQNSGSNIDLKFESLTAPKLPKKPKAA